MIRFCKIIIIGWLIVWLSGCGQAEEEAPFWEKVKIGDLRPASGPAQPGGQSLVPMEFGIYFFEVPADKFDLLADIREELHTKPLQFADGDAFGANAFSAGFGRMQMWDKIGDILRSADAKRTKTTSFVTFGPDKDDIGVTTLDTEGTIFYASAGEVLAGVTHEAGYLALRIRVEKIPGARGVCKVGVQPVFRSEMRGRVARPAEGRARGEIVFESAGFELKMSPGDFVLLGAGSYRPGEMTLGSLLFTKPEPKPAVRMYLIVCNRIAD